MGFVLGEAAAWWAESGYIWKGNHWFVLWGIVGFLLPAAFLTAVWLMGKVKGQRPVWGQWRELSRSMRWYLRMLLLLCVFTIGYVRMDHGFASWNQIMERLPEEESVASVSGQVLDIREKGMYQVITLKTSMEGKVLVYVKTREKWKKTNGRGDEELLETLSIREEITATGKVRIPKRARNPGQFDLKNYYRAQGISMMLFADSLEKENSLQAKSSGSPYFNGLYRIRRSCGRILEQICEEEDKGIFQAAILGEKEGMKEEIKNLYQKSGIAHLLAISGLHLSMIGAGCYGLLRKAGFRYGTSGLISGAIIVSYGLMTGGSGSAIRALIMLLVSFLASYLGRTYDLLSALSLAAILLSWSQPFLVGEAGFQLSFGAVLGIGLLGDELIRAAEMKKAWQKNLLVSLAIQLMTGPVIFWHYFQYPVYGILLNLLVIPLMGYVILSGLMGIGLGFFVPLLGVAAVGSGHYILWWYQKLCQIVLSLPGCQAVFGRPKWQQVAAYYLILAGTIGILRLSGRNRDKIEAKLNKSGDDIFGKNKTERKSGDKNRNIGSKRRKWGKGAKRILIGAGAAGCLCSLYPIHHKGCDITFLDVGQGDGIVIQCERSSWDFRRPSVVLVDGGSTSEKEVGKNRLEPYLKSEGITKIDAAIVSHGDEDHISGLLYLLKECREIQIETIILPKLGQEDEAYCRLTEAGKERGSRILYMKAGDWIEAGRCRFTCLYPKGDDVVDPSDRNQQSLIVRMDYEDFHLLLTGDANREGEVRMIKRQGKGALLKIQVLKASHHGSRFSNSRELLEAVKPALTVISYEEGNSYGHPHKEALERFIEAGSKVLKTGEQGAVLMHVEGGRLEYKTYLHNES